MENVTIMTSEESFSNNYGAALQGYALFSKIVDLGYDAKTVRYQGGNFENNRITCIYYLVRSKVGRIYHTVFPNPNARKIKELHKKYEASIRLRKRFFDDFQLNHMRFYNDKRYNWDKLKKNPPQSRIYVCGSDQIWNPYFKRMRNDPGYFLAFAPNDAVKIAYAPSFGCSDLPAPAKNDLGNYLKSFSAISVREESGIDIVKKYAQRDAVCVSDPTLILTPEEWSDFAKVPSGVPERYILCYRFADSEYTKKTIDALSEALQLPVVSLPLSNVALGDSYNFVFNAGPQEFVGLIKNAELVCTDSFHAAVFSILMKRPLCVFLREGFTETDSMNVRVWGLLKKLRLEKLIVNENDDMSKALECMNADYTAAHGIIADERLRSLLFLKNALECDKKAE